MSPQELLSANGIALESYAPGRHYATCPQCSNARKHGHQKLKCLGVTIDGDRVHWGCNHCNWTGPPRGLGNGGGDAPALDRCHLYGETLRKVKNPPGRKQRFFWQHLNGKGEWESSNGGTKTSTLLYRIDEAREAIAASEMIAIVEGEKDADNLWRLGISAICNAHGASDLGKKPKWTTAHSEQLRGADIIVFNDNDAPGYAHADATCKLSLGIAKRVRRLDLKLHWYDIGKGDDVSDWLAAGGEHTPERLRELIEAAPDYTPEPESEPSPAPEPEPAQPDDDAELERLARLSRVEYERQRKKAADALEVRVAMLDRLVKSRRTELGLSGDDGIQGRAVEYEEPEPWLEPVDGAKLLDDLTASARRFTVLPPDAAEESALWVAHTYLIDATDITPRLQVSSPTKGCGKTTYLDWLSEVVYRPDLASNISASALFRTVEKWRPSLLLDEADSFLFENEPMRNVLNSGHHVKGNVKISVKVGDNYEPRIFSTFAPVVFGLIGELKGSLATVNDRSIRIVLQRRKPEEKIESLSGPRRRDEFKPLRQRLMRFAQEHRAGIAGAEPQIPEGLYNRVADNWRPLFAIADAAGGEWPKKAREIAMRAAPSEQQTAVEMLIADIWEVFNATGSDRIGSQKLVEKLGEMTDRPWPEFGKSGKPITQAKLAHLLKRPGLGISPDQIRVTDDEGNEKQIRGYECSWFAEAFARFVHEKGLPKCPSVTNPIKTGTSDIFKASQPDSAVTDRKSQKSNNDGVCDGVTLRGGNGQDDGKGLSIRAIDALGGRYEDEVYQRVKAGESEADVRRELDATIRRQLRDDYGVLPEFIDVELERVIDAAFRPRGS